MVEHSRPPIDDTETALAPVQLRPTYKSMSDSSAKDVDNIVAEEIAVARKIALENTEKRRLAEEEENAAAAGKKGKKKKAEKAGEPKVSMRELFQYADGWDRLMIAAGMITAALSGSVQPLMTIIFSSLINVFTDYTIKTLRQDPTARSEFEDGIRTYIIYFLILAAATFIVGYSQMTLWMVSGERQCKRIRELYYASLLRQETAYFDTNSTGDLTSRLSGDISLMQEGMSEKVGQIIQGVFTFLFAFGVGFYQGWKIALVLLSVIPLLMASGAFMARTVSARSTGGQDAYGRAGHLAEEVLSSIKTVAAFGGEKQEIVRYEKELDEGLQHGTRRGIVTGIGVGTMTFIIFGAYGLAFWYGSTRVAAREASGGEVLNVIFAMIIGAFALGGASPNFAAISTAQGAAVKIFSVIKRVSLIDSSTSTGRVLNDVQGKLVFSNITFHYPSRPDVTVLKDFSLTVNPGETVALVGSSGSGKSTIVGLTERFYDPPSGTVTLDGVDLRQINVKSLRQKVGLVSQEPILFGVSIYQNIAWGASSDDNIPTREQVIEACKMANAHDFISQLPQGYDTQVGQKGALLSGGQKQRIVIARALIKNPPILLLDEATSALDTESERLVQEALDRLASRRTTVVVAHRLSTIKNAAKIVVMDRGTIVEIGRHDELIARRGMYAKLVRAQEIKSLKSTSTSDAAVLASANVDSTSEIDAESSSLDFTPVAKQVTRAKTRDSFKDKEEKEKQRLANYAKRSLPWKRIIDLNKPEKWFIFFGVFGAMVDGAVMPLFSVLFSSILSVFSQVDNPEKLQQDANFWAFMFGVLGCVSFFAVFARIGIFAVSGERLTKRLRLLSFKAMLQQEAGFFDIPDNGSGSLNAKLATEAEQIRGLSGQVIGAVIQAMTSLGVGLGIAFAYGWKLTLVVLACVPLLGFASGLQLQALAGYGGKTKKAYEDSAQIATESIENMRTVSSLAREDTFSKLYSKKIIAPHKLAIRGAIISSVGFGLSQSLVFLVYSVAFYYGSTLIISQEYTVDIMFRVLFAVVFAAVAVGQASSFTPSVAKAKVAAISLFDIVDRKSTIDWTNPDGVDIEPFDGKVRARDVIFKYPARPDVTVLRGFNAEVLAGKTVALVGSSGSGKSTLVSLVQRFYDVENGAVTVQGSDVRDWRVASLRSKMSLVGQEPVLFDRTIEENIAYGVENASHDMVIQAAKAANIHDFIINLPDGYDTRVGERGAQLSGGQRQRVAIARALIRNPRLLLLDEATSALDSTSERIVQSALDNAARGRTTITIAHRLSTIQTADVILVVKSGNVVEKGTHNELLTLNGLYAKLCQKQNLN